VLASEVRVRLLDRRCLGSGGRRVGALPFIWGTLYSSVLASSSRPRFQSALRSSFQSSVPRCIPTAAGLLDERRRDSVDRVRPVGISCSCRQSEGSSRRCLPRSGRCRSSAVRARRRDAIGGDHPRHQVIPFVCRWRAKCSNRCRWRSANGVRAWRYAVRGDQRALFYARPASSAPSCSFGRALGETMAVTIVIGTIRSFALAVCPQYTKARCSPRVHRGG